MSEERVEGLAAVFERRRLRDRIRKALGGRKIAAALALAAVVVAAAVIAAAGPGTAPARPPVVEKDVLVVAGHERYVGARIRVGVLNVTASSCLLLEGCELSAGTVVLGDNATMVAEDSRLCVERVDGSGGSIVLARSELSCYNATVASFSAVNSTIRGLAAAGVAELLNCRADELRVSREANVSGSAVGRIVAAGARVYIDGGRAEVVARSSSIRARFAEVSLVAEECAVLANACVVPEAALNATTAAFVACNTTVLSCAGSYVECSPPPSALDADNASTVLVNTTFAVRFVDASGAPVVGSAVVSSDLSGPFEVHGPRAVVSVRTAVIEGGGNRTSPVRLRCAAPLVAILGAPYENGTAVLGPAFSGEITFVVGESDVRILSSDAVIRSAAVYGPRMSLDVEAPDGGQIVVQSPHPPRDVRLGGARLLNGTAPGWLYEDGTLTITLPPTARGRLVVEFEVPEKTAAAAAGGAGEGGVPVFAVVAPLVLGLVLVAVLMLAVCRSPAAAGAMMLAAVACSVMTAALGPELGPSVSMVAIAAVFLALFAYFRWKCAAPSG